MTNSYENIGILSLVCAKLAMEAKLSYVIFLNVIDYLIWVCVIQRHCMPCSTTYSVSLQFPVIVKEYSAINHINFCEASPHDFLVTCSSKVIDANFYNASFHHVV